MQDDPGSTIAEWLRERSGALSWRTRIGYALLPPRCVLCGGEGDLGAVDLCGCCLATLPFADPAAGRSAPVPRATFAPFIYRDPVGMVSYSPHAFGVHPSVPVNTVKELIDYAKANPGKLNFAISGTGGAPHLAGIAFAQRTGINWAYIPYKGGSQAVADVASGQANVIMNGMLATYPTMKSGRIRALAISSAQRVSSAPEVPTIAETLPGFETGSYQGLLAPAGTPRDVVGKLNAEVAKILATQEMREKLAVLGTEVRTAQPEALGTFIAAEKTRWAQVIKESGIKFD